MITTPHSALRLRFPALVFAGACTTAALAADGDWLSYNKTLTSERFSPLDEITPANVGDLEMICMYDTGQKVALHTGPLVVGDTLFATTETDTFALDAASCEERWRVQADVMPSFLKTNRGLAYADGRLFRGLQDGRVVAYDASDGERLWERRIADPEAGESVPAAPIAWDGLVFVGNAGGDNYGVKGRMYALDADNGEIVWEFYLVPKEDGTARGVASARGESEGRAAQRSRSAVERDGNDEAERGAEATDEGDGRAVLRGYDPERALAETWGNEAGVPITGGATWTSYTLDPDAGLLYVPGGNPAPDFIPALRPGSNLLTNSIVVIDARTGSYRAHYQLVPEDFHDWDVAAAPILFTANGRRMLVAAPKDGLLYGFDLESGERLYVEPITRRENTDAPLTRAGTRFCPGTQGGVEWNGPAYSPSTGLVYTGAVDWCTTVMTADPEQARSASIGQPWSGSADEENVFGVFDSQDTWAGWVYARNGETGEQAWRFETPAPILSGVTPTGGGLVFFGDMQGNVYALDAKNGERLWSHDLDASVAGGVISYEADGNQRIAFAAGMTSPIWPTQEATGRIVVFGLR